MVFDRLVAHISQGGSGDTETETKAKEYPIEIIGLFDVKEVKEKNQQEILKKTRIKK